MKAVIQKVKRHPFVQNVLRFYQGADSDFSSIAVAYYLLVAIFPILFLLSAVLPYLQINVQDVLGFLKTTLPKEVYGYLSGIVVSILTTPSSGWLGISIATTLWTFSQSMVVLQKAFNKAYGMENHRDMIVGRVVGILIGLVLQVGLFLLISVGFFGETLITFINRYIAIDLAFFREILSWTQPLIYLGFVLVLLILYTFLPNVRIRKLRYILPGTVFVISVLATTTNLVSIYLSRYMTKFESFHLVSYVLLLVVMVWFIVIAQVLIIGAVLNASVQALYEPRFTPRRGTVAGIVEKIRFLKHKKSGRFRKAKGLVVMDVDGTFIREQVFDVLGDLASIRLQLSVIEDQVKQGQLDVEQAFKARVSLLKGLPETIFDMVNSQLHLTQGARELVLELHARGYKIGLVSESFHENVDTLAAELGIDYVKANRLEVRDGQLTGNIIGQVVTKTTKLTMLKAWTNENGLTLSQTIAIGDDGNDLPMIEMAGIGIAFKADPIVKALSAHSIDEANLYKVIDFIDRHNRK